MRVTDFLTRARERKFAVPDNASGARASIVCAILAANTADLGASERRHQISPTALYVLARNGVVPIGDLRYLADSKLDALTTPIAKAQVAAALALVGDRARAERVYAAALAAIDPQSENWLNRQDYGSNLRDAAALVTLASESGAAPATVQAAVQRVEASRAQLHPTSTQEDAWLLLAASAMAKDPGNVTLDAARRRRAARASTAPSAPTISTGAGESHQSPATLRSRPWSTVTGALLTPEPAAENGFRIERLDPARPTAIRSTRHRSSRTPGSVVVLKITEAQPHWRQRTSSPITCRLGSRIDNPHLVSVRRYRHFCRGSPTRLESHEHGDPRRPLHRRLERKRRSGGVHRGLCGARGGRPAAMRAAGARRGHVPAGSLRPHRAAAPSRSRRRNDALSSPRGSEGDEAIQDFGKADWIASRSSISGRPLRSLDPLARNDGQESAPYARRRAFLCASAFAGAAWWIASPGRGAARRTRFLDQRGRSGSGACCAPTRRAKAATTTRSPTSIHASSTAQPAYEATRPASITGSILARCCARRCNRNQRLERLACASTRPCRWRGSLSRLEVRRSMVTNCARWCARSRSSARAGSGDENILRFTRPRPWRQYLHAFRAASLAYFGKEPRHLSRGEAALLRHCRNAGRCAARIASPRSRVPRDHPRARSPSAATCAVPADRTLANRVARTAAACCWRAARRRQSRRRTDAIEVHRLTIDAGVQKIWKISRGERPCSRARRSAPTSRFAGLPSTMRTSDFGQRRPLDEDDLRRAAKST